MRKILPYLLLATIALLPIPYAIRHVRSVNTGAPPYEIEDLEPPLDPYAWIKEWKRPEGPVRVGLQAGHYLNEQLPEEQSRLIGSTGTHGGGTTEVAVNLAIAEKTKAILEKEGITVDILPATVPERYYADAFVSIHADGSTDKVTSGYKLSPPRRDFSGKADRLAELVYEKYGESTGLSRDSNITRNMRGYYAFAWWRYDHAVHPRAPAIILETGFLTNEIDRKIIVNRQDLAAHGLAQGILAFINENK